MEHSKVFAFSSSYRLMNCHASRRMSEGEPDEESEFAKLGTAGHALSEHCLTWGFKPYECKGLTFNGFVADQDMIDSVTVYTGLIESLQVKLNITWYIEKRVHMTSLGRNDVFGTSDSIGVDLVNRTLYVIDYKHGEYTVVEIENNTQLIGYALAALDELKLWGQIETVVTMIVQPRAPHRDGPIREHTYSVLELRDEWFPRYYEAVVQGENPSSKAVAGDHCMHCPARGSCRTKVQHDLDIIYRSDTPLDKLTNEEVEYLYENLKSAKKCLDAIEKRALRIAHEGYRFSSFKMVDSRTRYTCTDEEGLYQRAVKDVGVEKASELYEKKLVSMSKAKKVLPPDIVNDFYEKPEVTATLAPLNDPRPARRTGSAQGIFAAII
mgnify:CR=1 FL=1